MNPFKDFLDSRSISLDLAGSTKQEILDNLLSLIEKSTDVSNHERVKEELLEREGLGSTGIGSGVAVPHCKTNSVEKTTIAFGRTSNPIQFDSIDGQPVSLFFLILSPKNENLGHLKTLSYIAKVIKNEKERNKLLKIETEQDIVHFFTEEI